MILCISVLSVVSSPFSFLILLIWFFSPFVSWWVWLMVCQFYLSSQRTSFWFYWFLLWSLFFKIRKQEDKSQRGRQTRNPNKLSKSYISLSVFDKYQLSLEKKAIITTYKSKSKNAQLSLQGPHNERWPTSHSSPKSYSFNCINKERVRYMLAFAFLSCSNQ